MRNVLLIFPYVSIFHIDTILSSNILICLCIYANVCLTPVIIKLRFLKRGRCLFVSEILLMIHSCMFYFIHLDSRQSNTTHLSHPLLRFLFTFSFKESRVDITELTEIKRLFRSKYGKTFVETALSDEGGICNARVVTKLSVSPPSAYLVQIYLEKIAEQFGIDWEPTIKLDAGDMLRPTAAPTGYSIVVAPGSGLAPAAGEVTIMGSHDSDAAPAAGVVPSTVIPQAPYIPPYVPPSTCEKLEEEVDIIVTPFVPTCTTASIMEENSNGSGDSLLPTETGQNESGGDMDKKRGDDAPLSTFSMDSYDALKARFDQLKQK